jgi:CheY-like chemotaxis protein
VRAAVLCRDLLFGTRVEGALAAAGHEARRFGDAAAVAAAGEVFDVLIVDLTDSDLDGVAALAGLRARRELDGVAALGFYAHVDQEMRRRAEEAGFDLVVPRSRMAREGAALVQNLARR